MKLDYLLLDVFTRDRLQGNQLAVVLKGDGLLDNEMQAIAREFNLSETVFITKPQNERNSAGIRIFTPFQELPFASHPTVGAAVVLGLQNDRTAVRMEERIGLVTALFEKADKRSGEARFALPRLSSKVADLTDKLSIAQGLGIEVEEIGCDIFAPAVYSAGVTFHLIPVRDAGVLRRVRPNVAMFNEVFFHDHHSAYVFTLTPEESDNDIAARMFSNTAGEDPGTGSAAAALIGLLSDKADFASGQADYMLRQGKEMGRLCRISLQLRRENEVLIHGAIGGHAVIVGEGQLDLS
jgi:trans-2,3-dihydro-3-hydroxyanthranilate isomerase